QVGFGFRHGRGLLSSMAIIESDNNTRNENRQAPGGAGQDGRRPHERPLVHIVLVHAANGGARS
ncbi:MAG: hypothetical protein P8Y05_12645, partial [Deinococcales bacterium]